MDIAKWQRNTAACTKAHVLLSTPVMARQEAPIEGTIMAKITIAGANAKINVNRTHEENGFEKKSEHGEHSLSIHSWLQNCWQHRSMHFPQSAKHFPQVFAMHLFIPSQHEPTALQIPSQALLIALHGATHSARAITAAMTYPYLCRW